MAEQFGTELDGVQSLRNELGEIGRSVRSSFRIRTLSLRSTSGRSSSKAGRNGEHDLQWAAIERLPTFERLRKSVFEKEDEGVERMVVDVTKLGPGERHLFIEKLIKHTEQDNLRLLRKIRERTDRVDLKLPKIEVRYRNLCVESDCQIVHGKPLPTLWNSLNDTLCGFTKFPFSRWNRTKISIVEGASGMIKPGRMTLLLGPPGCGKTTFLKALAGNLHKHLELTGDVSYNGYKLDEFVTQKTPAYISQYDLHIPQMTVRETLDFSARCQGVGSRE
ncbi:hypothetical protein CRG98_026533, partial [Punica granatum]